MPCNSRVCLALCCCFKGAAKTWVVACLFRHDGPGGARHLVGQSHGHKLGGKRMYLWRAVDAEGEVLDCLVQSRRNKRAALRLMRKLIRKYRMVPSTFVTDRLPSYAAARAELPLPIAYERGLRQNNRAESSHVPVRRRERKMQRFRSAGSAQRFLSSHASVYNTFNICRHLITSATKRRFRTEAFEAWRAAAGIAA